MSETSKIVQQKTQFFPGKIEHIKKNHFALPTWSLLGFLVVTFIILKSFIYITDEKRKNK